MEVEDAMFCRVAVLWLIESMKIQSSAFEALVRRYDVGLVLIQGSWSSSPAFV